MYTVKGYVSVSEDDKRLAFIAGPFVDRHAAEMVALRVVDRLDVKQVVIVPGG